MTTPTTPQPPITGKAPFYSNPEPLNPGLHGALGLRTVANPYSFGEKQHFLPLLATEFVPSAMFYPIIFAGDDFTPLAVTGLNDGENLFYDNGVLRSDIYIPAYMRRYPFITAADETGERMVVCIDRDSSLIGEKAETPFFENGELSQYAKNCVEFCQNFENDRIRTTQMVARLRELDLFETRDATFTPQVAPGQPAAEPQRVASFAAISEAKLNALPAETYISLRDSGYLTAIHAHLFSLNNWERLIGMSLRRRMEEQQAAQGGKPN